MTLQEIINGVNIFTDESFTMSEMIVLANRAISRINTNCDTYFPEYTTTTATYNAIPSNWQRDLLGNYMAYGIKMNDTSLSDADRYLEEFYKVLGDFKEKIGVLVNTGQIDAEYVEQEGFGGAYGIDTSFAIDTGWFGGNGNAGSM